MVARKHAVRILAAVLCIVSTFATAPLHADSDCWNEEPDALFLLIWYDPLDLWFTEVEFFFPLLDEFLEPDWHAESEIDGCGRPEPMERFWGCTADVWQTCARSKKQSELLLGYLWSVSAHVIEREPIFWEKEAEPSFLPGFHSEQEAQR